MQTTAVQSRKKTRPQEAAGSFRCVNLRSGITPHALLRAISFARLDLGNAPRLLVVGPRPMGLMPCMGSWGPMLCVLRDVSRIPESQIACAKVVVSCMVDILFHILCPT